MIVVEHDTGSALLASLVNTVLIDLVSGVNVLGPKGLKRRVVKRERAGRVTVEVRTYRLLLVLTQIVFGLEKRAAALQYINT